MVCVKWADFHSHPNQTGDNNETVKNDCRLGYKIGIQRNVFTYRPKTRNIYVINIVVKVTTTIFQIGRNVSRHGSGFLRRRWRISHYPIFCFEIGLRWRRGGVWLTIKFWRFFYDIRLSMLRIISTI